MQSSAIFISEMNSDRKYYLSAVTSIRNNARTTLTTYPTSEGTPMSDNAYREPYTITMSLTSSEFNKSKNILDTNEETTLSTDMAKLKQIFFDWRYNFTRLILQTRHMQYINMIITDISWNDDNSTLGKFEPSITFSECRVASIYTEVLGPFDGYESEGTYGAEEYHGNDNGFPVGEVVTGVVGGAAAGALIGSVIPGVGTAIGAVVGGVIGAVWGGVSSYGNYVGWW